MLLPLDLFLLGGATLVSLVTAQVDTQLTGTWTTKSRKVFTGPVRAPSLPRLYLWINNRYQWASTTYMYNREY